jgi:ribonuclease BN (tRNA processing enzyme)
MSCCSRHDFLTAAGSVVAPVVFFPARAPAQQALPAASPRTKVVLLGTAGGPGIRGKRRQPATLIVVDGVPYLIDCGNGVAEALYDAGVGVANVGTVLVTHHHSDHIADFGALLLLAWGNGRKTPIATYGPPPLSAVRDAFLAAYARDIAVRQSDEGRPPLAPLIGVTEIARDGVILRDERVTITAALGDHGAMKPALAYRFDTPDRAIVVSGDTTYSENLIRLARGADLLIHEALYLPGLDRLLAVAGNNAPTLREHLLSAHTTTEDVGRVAAAAQVRGLVLTHFVPAADPASDDQWLAGVRRSYGGPAVAGRDGLVV